MLKKYSLQVGVIYTIVLTILSLVKLNIPTPNLPSYKDKIVHVLAHVIFTILWFLVFNNRFKIKFNRALLYSALFSLVYGLLIEILQGVVTLSRQTDVKDVIANTIGMIFALLLLLSMKKGMLKNNNTLLF